MGIEPTEIVIYYAFAYRFLVRPDAFGAHDAFGKIPYQERVDILDTGMIGHLVEAVGPHTHLRRQVAQFALVSPLTDYA